METDVFGVPSSPLDLGPVTLAEERVSAYLRAVGDGQLIYWDSGFAPPLFGVALLLGQILRRGGLPPGAIHSLQEFDTLRPVAIGSSLQASCWLERQRERAGLRFLTIAAKMDSEDGETALSIKTTLLVPAETSPAQPGNTRDTSPQPLPASSPAEDSKFPTVRRAITQQQLAEYAAVSGDDNPLHLDAQFAAGTQFGGIIAHGMLTLAFVSEMLAASLGESWLASGSLQARFRGAAYPGDHVETWGSYAKSNGTAQAYAVGLRGLNSGSDLITGTATVKINQ